METIKAPDAAADTAAHAAGGLLNLDWEFTKAQLPDVRKSEHREHPNRAIVNTCVAPSHVVTALDEGAVAQRQQHLLHLRRQALEELNLCACSS